jgi:nucleoid DNA-binding protein
MFSLLHEYLVDNRSLHLPGTGTLQLERQSASFDVANQEMQPPHTKVHFSRNASGRDDSLVRFISSRLDIANENARQLFESFCEKLATDLKEHGQVHWHNLGNFGKDEKGKPVFHPEAKASSLFASVPAVRVIRLGTTHNMVVGSNETTSTKMQEYLTEQAAYKPADRWWIPALIIGIVTIALILLKRLHYL